MNLVKRPRLLLLSMIGVVVASACVIISQLLPRTAPGQVTQLAIDFTIAAGVIMLAAVAGLIVSLTAPPHSSRTK